MTRRTVIWEPSAENELISIWLAAIHRLGVTSATDKIDLELRSDAEKHGTLLAEGLYAIEHDPLRAIFEILHDDAIVRVLKIKPTRVS